MLIDVHTHVFPEKIAARVLASMAEGLKVYYDIFRLEIPPKTDGTVAGLLDSMDKSGCDISVLCPIVTNEKSTKNTNDFVWSQRSSRIIPFASLLHSQRNREETLEEIAARGFKGIKLHPEFQDFDIDSARSVEIIRKAEELGLVIIIHAGLDPSFAPPSHCSPERIARLLDKVDGRKIIAAHMGGWRQWEDVERLLLDSPIYFDTSFTAGHIEPSFCAHLMRGHGIEKILFGSDSPWQTAGEVFEFVKTLGLSEEELSKVAYKNAAELLDVEI